MNAGENKPTGLLRLLKKVIFFFPPKGGESRFPQTKE